MTEKLNSYPYQDFTCDSCQKEFQNKTAYSSARNLNEVEGYYTYCTYCVKPEKIQSPPPGEGLRIKNWKKNEVLPLLTRLPKTFNL